MSQNGATQRSAGFWSIPRREAAILKLRNAGEREKSLRVLRKMRWGYLIAYALLAVTFFLPHPSMSTSEFNFTFLFLLVFGLYNELHIDQILIIGLLDLGVGQDEGGVGVAHNPAAPADQKAPLPGR